MNDAKEEIRERLAIEDVIGEYVQLSRAGRNLKGLSPFTDERTPSFMVSPEKQIWHDFSSGKGGDIFSFIMMIEGMDFRGALEHLARKAGVELQLLSQGDRRLSQRRQRAREALRLAATFYQQNLLQSQKALDYTVKKRRLNRQTIADFMIGYAPDSKSALVAALKKRGFTASELRDAGLRSRFDGDLFRGRMMVAFHDTSGEVIGFTGRIIHDDPQAPKYLNTPQTILFDKSRYIFGLFQAREAIRKSDVAVIVEGNLDVVSSHQAGVKNVVAASGTALTVQHLKALSRLAGRVRLAFDGDQAGVNATERAIGLAQEVGIELEVITLPEGVKDPDELIQLDSQLWQAAIDQAHPAVDWVIARYQELEDITSAEGKRRFSTKALAIIRNLKDPVEREHYLKIIARKTGATMAALQAKLETKSTPASKLRRSKIAKEAASKVADDTEDILLGLAINEQAARRWLTTLSTEMMEKHEAQILLQYLQQHSDTNLAIIPKDLQKIELYVKMVQLKSDNRYADWDAEALQHETARLVKKIILKHRENKKNQLLTRLREAEVRGDEAAAHDLRQQLNRLIKEKA